MKEEHYEDRSKESGEELHQVKQEKEPVWEEKKHKIYKVYNEYVVKGEQLPVGI